MRNRLRRLRYRLHRVDQKMADGMKQLSMRVWGTILGLVFVLSAVGAIWVGLMLMDVHLLILLITLPVLIPAFLYGIGLGIPFTIAAALGKGDFSNSVKEALDD